MKKFDLNFDNLTNRQAKLLGKFEKPVLLQPGGVCDLALKKSKLVKLRDLNEKCVLEDLLPLLIVSR